MGDTRTFIENAIRFNVVILLSAGRSTVPVYECSHLVNFEFNISYDKFIKISFPIMIHILERRQLGQSFDMLQRLRGFPLQ